MKKASLSNIILFILITLSEIFNATMTPDRTTQSIEHSFFMTKYQVSSDEWIGVLNFTYLFILIGIIFNVYFLLRQNINNQKN